MRDSKKIRDIHDEAIRNFDAIQEALYPERKQSLEDRRFYSIAGAQWEGSLGEQFENKPKFEVNKVHLAVMRIINEYRNNRITVDFISKDGMNNDDMADTCAHSTNFTGLVLITIFTGPYIGALWQSYNFAVTTRAGKSCPDQNLLWPLGHSC